VKFLVVVVGPHLRVCSESLEISVVLISGRICHCSDISRRLDGYTYRFLHWHCQSLPCAKLTSTCLKLSGSNFSLLWLFFGSPFYWVNTLPRQSTQDLLISHHKSEKGMPRSAHVRYLRVSLSGFHVLLISALVGDHCVGLDDTISFPCPADNSIITVLSC
jgi:hypothetical protein